MNPLVTRIRHPGIAAVLSLLLPGLGHLYVGRPRIALGGLLVSPVQLAILYLGARWLPAGLVVLPVATGITLWIGFAVHAADVARRAGDAYALRWYNRWYVYAAVYLVVGVLLAPAESDFGREHLVQGFRTPSGAMEPTILMVGGDTLWMISDTLFRNSRYTGFIPDVNVIGTPKVVYFSIVSSPKSNPLSRVRWGRIGTRVR